MISCRLDIVIIGQVCMCISWVFTLSTMSSVFTWPSVIPTDNVIRTGRVTVYIPSECRSYVPCTLAMGTNRNSVRFHITCCYKFFYKEIIWTPDSEIMIYWYKSGILYLLWMKKSIKNWNITELIQRCTRAAHHWCRSSFLWTDKSSLK